LASPPGLTDLRRIIVGLDGSDDAQRALEWAILIAERFQAEVVAVHAVGLLSHGRDGSLVPSHPHLAEIRQLFTTEWCRSLNSSAVLCRRIVREGPPVRALLDVASEEDADLVVLGTRGIGGLTHVLLGSTSHQVLEHSDRAVMVVRAECPERVIPTKDR
jgi:nucleotide-binding universal stress UspA family protein